MRNILITGGSGFIASHLVDALSAQGNHVYVLDVYQRQYGDLPQTARFFQASLMDENLVRRILEENQIDLIYHAAWANIHEIALKDPAGDLQTNLVASIHLLNACRDAHVKRVVYLSSGGTVYGLPNHFPVSESAPTDPINAYGITKLMVEKYLRMFQYLYGLEYTVLRPSVPYGPRQNPFRHQGALTIFIHRALAGEPVTIFGDGSVVRDYFYIGDLTRALVSAGDVVFGPSMTTFNLGGGHPYTLHDLVRIIESVLGVKMKVNYEPARSFDAPKILLDITLAKKHLNWEPFVSMEEGIQLTADWVKRTILS